jgi:hypothetical protein
MLAEQHLYIEYIEEYNWHSKYKYFQRGYKYDIGNFNIDNDKDISK